MVPVGKAGFGDWEPRKGCSRLLEGEGRSRRHSLVWSQSCGLYPVMPEREGPEGQKR